METLADQILMRIDHRTAEMQVTLTQQRIEIGQLRAQVGDHEARLRVLQDAEAVSRSDLRRWGLVITILILGGMGVGTVLIRGELDRHDSPSAATSGMRGPVEVTP